MAQIVSIASGKGGVGKSVVSANLALLLAQRGHRVVLADLDVGGADCHVLFGQLHPPATLTDFLSRRIPRLADAVQPTTLHARLSLLPGTGETLASANMAYAAKKRLIRHLRDLEADVIVADIGAGTGFHALDFFLMADHRCVVATPDPTSVLDLYRFIKLAAIRLVLSHFLSRHAIADALTERDFANVEEVLTVAGQADVEGREVAAGVLAGFTPALVLNRVSERSRVNVGRLQRLLTDYIGGTGRLLGEIPEDDAVVRSVRRFLPVVESDPCSPSARALARIAEETARLLRLPGSVRPAVAELA